MAAAKACSAASCRTALEKHPLVVSFYDAPESHLGATVAILKGSGLAP